MNIVILGAGKTGSFAASILSREGHNVTVVDQDGFALEKIGRETDISTLNASLDRLNFFETLFETKPDLLFAATGHDETNLVACAIAKNLGFPKTAALIRSSGYLFHEHLDFKRLFFVDHFLASEKLAAQDLFDILIHTGDLAIEHFAQGTVQMRTLEVPQNWTESGTPLKELDLPEELIIGFIRRKGQTEEMLLIPHGNDPIIHGDVMTLVGQAHAMNQAHKRFSIAEPKVKSAILVGGSPVVVHLGELLLKQNINVRIIDRDLKRCEAIADFLPKATVINRDGADSQLLKTEKVQHADVLVACTRSDASNLLIAALAKQVGCKRAIALATDPSMGCIFEQLDIIPAFSARMNTANKLLSIASGKMVLSVTPIADNGAKIIEIKIPSQSKVIGTPLSKLHLPKGLLVAAIENKGQVLVGKGDRTISANDTIIVICDARHVGRLHDLF